jgi:hypothetical protein
VSSSQARLAGNASVVALTPRKTMFIFFSNRLGCGGSLLVSAVVTAILLLLLGVIELG